jgi:lipopolysaccharide biosynthesis glycosyltransferase
MRCSSSGEGFLEAVIVSSMRELEPVVLALASDENYFPGLYCAVTSALNAVDPARKVEVKVLDGGLSQFSRDTLANLIERTGKRVRLDFVKTDPSIFGKATLGPGRSHMTYCRILLPHLLGVPRLIYLDCDVLVFSDLSQLFDFKLPAGKLVAAVPDSETLSLADDSLVLARAMKLSAEDRYFNAGVMLMDLDGLRNQDFYQRAVEFLNRWTGHYRFWDQSASNFLLHGQIETLPEYWNRAAWRFDAQQDNELDCVLHYTTCAPWLGGPRTPSQILFERFAEEAAFPVNRGSSEFKRSVRRNFWRNALAPLRAFAFPIWSFLYGIAGKKEKSAAFNKVARYWLDYIHNTPTRRQLYRRRSQEISKMKFDLRTSPLAS